MKSQKKELDKKIEQYRLLLNDLYQKEGMITPEIISYSQILDRLISEYYLDFAEHP